METLASLLDGFGDDPAVTIGLLGLVGGAVLVLALWELVRDRMVLRRRASEGVEARPASGARGGSASVDRVVGFLEANFSAGDAKEQRLLRRQLIQAGFFDPRALAIFFGARMAGGLVFAAGGLAFLPFVLGDTPRHVLWMWAAGLGILGYFLPSMYLRRRIAARVLQHRMGFPDFMDLMVVCSEAGLSMEAGIERIARELVEGYPSLAENLYMLSLELRAGKAFPDALDRLGDRLGIEEATMLATLLQQSSELGTSLSQSLRVYSEEMRHKRLSRAEEKAYALPAKLVVPLILFVFPVLLFTLMLPVVIRISQANIGG
jgi:tight adherence protein C